MVRAAHDPLGNDGGVWLNRCKVVVSGSVTAARGGTSSSGTIEHLGSVPPAGKFISFPFFVHSSYSSSYKNTGNKKTVDTDVHFFRIESSVF